MNKYGLWEFYKAIINFMKIATRTKLSAFLNIRRTIPHTHTHTHTHTHAQSKDHRVDGSINDHRSNYKKS